MLEEAFSNLQEPPLVLPQSQEDSLSTVLTLPIEIDGRTIDFTVGPHDIVEDAVLAFGKLHHLSQSDVNVLYEEVNRHIAIQNAPPPVIASVVVMVDGEKHNVEQREGESAAAAGAAFAAKFGLGSEAASAVEDELVRAALEAAQQQQREAAQQYEQQQRQQQYEQQQQRQQLLQQQQQQQKQERSQHEQSETALRLAAESRARQAAAALVARAALEHDASNLDHILVDLRANGEPAPLLLKRHEAAEPAIREWCALMGLQDDEESRAFVVAEAQRALAAAEVRAANAAAAAAAAAAAEAVKAAKKSSKSTRAKPNSSTSWWFRSLLATSGFTSRPTVTLRDALSLTAFFGVIAALIVWRRYALHAGRSKWRRPHLAKVATRRFVERRSSLGKSSAKATPSGGSTSDGSEHSSPERGPPPLEGVSGKRGSKSASHSPKPEKRAAAADEGASAAITTSAGGPATTAPAHGTGDASEESLRKQGQSETAAAAAAATPAKDSFSWESFVAEEAARPGAALVQLCALSLTGAVLARTPDFGDLETHEACSLVRLTKSKAPEGTIGGRRYSVVARDDKLLLLSAKEGAAGNSKVLAARTRTAYLVARYGDLSKAEAREAAEALVDRSSGK